MYYITGDTHGSHITDFLKPGDTYIVAGDFGVGLYDDRNRSEENFFDYIAAQKYTVLFVMKIMKILTS